MMMETEQGCLFKGLLFLSPGFLLMGDCAFAEMISS